MLLRTVSLLLLLFCLATGLHAQKQKPDYLFDLSTPEATLQTNTSFIDSAAAGDLDAVNFYLKAGVDINARDSENWTALNAALDKRKFSTAKRLLDAGADPNIATDKGRTPLMTTIWRGFGYALDEREYEPARLVQDLLAKGAEVNALDYSGTTPLMEAASAGHVETIRALLARGADAGHKDQEGRTSIDVAAKERRGRAVQTLMDGGAPLTLRQKIIYYCYRFARLQGWILPFVILASFLVGYFGKKFTRPVVKRNAVEKGDDLPHLAPIKCGACGAGVPLRTENMNCPRCDSTVPVPEDYGRTMKLRERAGRQLQKAVAAWRRANRFTVWPIRWTLWLIALPWLAATLIGCFSNIGNSLFAVNTSTAFLAMFATLGGISLTVAFWAYASYLSGTRRRLPVIPNVGQKIGAAEVASCHLCGGGIAYAEGDLATLCSYCGGETYRVAIARRAHAVAAEEKVQATISLHDAMAEIFERRRRAFKYLMYASAIVFGLTFSVLIIAL